METTPNYANYSKEQLEGVLRRIDRERFPERVVEVEQRLIDGNYRKEEKNGSTNSPERDVPVKLNLKDGNRENSREIKTATLKGIQIVEKVGAGFLLFGVAYLVLNIFLQFGTDSYIFDLLPIAMGASLLRIKEHHLDQAVIFRWLAQIFIPVSILTTISTYAFIQPWDLSLTQFRLFPVDSFGFLVFFMLQIALMAWAVHTLSIPEIIQLQPKTRFFQMFLRNPIPVGLSTACIFVWGIHASLNGETAQQGLERAKRELGSGFNYAVTHVTTGKSKYGQRRIVFVTAWTQKEIIVIEENWND